MAYIREVRGHTPQVGENTFLAETAVLVGDVTVGRDCSIWYNAVLRGDVNTITIGDRTNIQDGVVVDFRASSGAAGPKVERSREVEELLIGHKVSELPALKGAFLDAWCNDVIAPHAMPEYRRNATRRMLEYFIDALVAGHPEGRVE
mgnify:CR=1 FL=1